MADEDGDLADLAEGAAGVAEVVELAAEIGASAESVFGIRPENISPLPRNVTGELSVPSTVVISEPLGAETLVTFQVGQVELVARCAASYKMPAGSQQTLYLDPQAMHLFDGDSGKAL